MKRDLAILTIFLWDQVFSITSVFLKFHDLKKKLVYYLLGIRLHVQSIKKCFEVYRSKHQRIEQVGCLLGFNPKTILSISETHSALNEDYVKLIDLLKNLS